MLKFLVIDDDLISREFLKSILQEKGSVTLAKSAAEAYELLKVTRFDHVFVDLCMPHENGANVVEYLKTRDSLQKTHIISASYPDRELFRFSPDSFIPKPFNRAKIYTILEVAE